MKRIAALAALAGVAALAGCSYNAESNFLGYRSSISYASPGAGPPPGPPPAGYYAAPPAPPPAYGPAVASCYRPGFYNRWGYWVPGRYRC